MQTATSGTQSKSRDLSVWVHHYTLRAPCIKDQGINVEITSYVGGCDSPHSIGAEVSLMPGHGARCGHAIVTGHTCDHG